MLGNRFESERDIPLAGWLAGWLVEVIAEHVLKTGPQNNISRFNSLLSLPNTFFTPLPNSHPLVQWK